jgi:hypothetical protein
MSRSETEKNCGRGCGVCGNPSAWKDAREGFWLDYDLNRDDFPCAREQQVYRALEEYESQTDIFAEIPGLHDLCECGECEWLRSQGRK